MSNCPTKKTDGWTLFKARMIVKGMRWFATLSDESWKCTFRGLEWILCRLDRNHPSLEMVRDARSIVEGDEQGRRALRNILTDFRQDQALSTIVGFFKHYGDRPCVAYPELAEGGPCVTTAQPCRVGIIGESYDKKWIDAAYSRRRNCDLIHWSPGMERPVFRGFLELADRIEILSLRDLNDGHLKTIFQSRRPISIHHTAFESLDRAKHVLQLADQKSATLRILYPPAYYAPVLKAKELLDHGELGELTILRARATVGGSGGSEEPDRNFKPDPLAHPGFDHLLFLTFLGGPIEKCAGYIQPFYKRAGGQALVNVKFEREGLYALLECSYAPEMHFRSAHLPYDFEAELVGTDGTLWLRRGMAARTQEPPIALRVGKSAYTMGVETPLIVDWDSVYDHLAADLIAASETGFSRRITGADLLSALSAREAAHRSNREKRVV